MGKNVMKQIEEIQDKDNVVSEQVTEHVVKNNGRATILRGTVAVIRAEGVIKTADLVVLGKDDKLAVEWKSFIVHQLTKEAEDLNWKVGDGLFPIFKYENVIYDENNEFSVHTRLQYIKDELKNKKDSSEVIRTNPRTFNVIAYYLYDLVHTLCTFR